MWTASSAGAERGDRPAAVQLVAPAQLGEDVARLLAVRIEPALLGPPPGPLLDRRVEEELQVGVGQDHGPDVAAGHDDPAGLRREGPLPLEQGRTELGDPAHGRDRLVDARGVDLVGHVAAVDRHVGQPPVRVGDQLDLGDERDQRARIRAGAVDADLALEGEPGRGPVQEAGVAEPVAESSAAAAPTLDFPDEPGPSRATTRPGWAVVTRRG